MMQRLITQQAVDQKGARYITDTLWLLMESGTEEVKVLQTVTLLLTSNAIVHGDTLARVRIYLYLNIFAFAFFNKMFQIFYSRLYFSRTWCFVSDYTLQKTVQQ